MGCTLSHHTSYEQPKVSPGTFIAQIDPLDPKRCVKVDPLDVCNSKVQDEDRSAPMAALDRKSTRLNSSHLKLSRMPSSA